MKIEHLGSGQIIFTDSGYIWARSTNIVEGMAAKDVELVFDSRVSDAGGAWLPLDTTAAGGTFNLTETLGVF